MMNRSTQLLWIGTSALAVGALVAILVVNRPPPLAAEPLPPAPKQAPAPEPPIPAKATLTVHPQPELTNKKSPVPLHKTSRYPPLTRFRFEQVPTAEPGKGIEFPDGTTVPYLNGMTWAPVVSRSSDVGSPIPPVIGLVVDQEGFEWYEHADGSTTTTRYKKVTAHGETYWDPASEHCAPRKPEHLIPAPELKPGDGPGTQRPPGNRG